MSDIDPDLPDYLVDAILSEDPPAEAVDLVKNAFTWRTIDAELMELTYDSVLDEAGVRDASARRTLEFNAGDITVILEVHGLVVAGSITPGQSGTARLSVRDAEVASAQIAAGRFRLVSDRPGAALMHFEIAGQVLVLPRFVLTD